MAALEEIPDLQASRGSGRSEPPECNSASWRLLLQAALEAALCSLQGLKSAPASAGNTEAGLHEAADPAGDTSRDRVEESGVEVQDAEALLHIAALTGLAAPGVR